MRGGRRGCLGELTQLRAVGCASLLEDEACYVLDAPSAGASDVLLEVLDARDPMGCRCLALEDAVLAKCRGKRLVLVLSAPVDAQGVFALVSNLGSLVARIFFAPLEEAAFAHFSQW